MSELAFDLAPEVRTTDVDEAADALGRVYVAAELTPIDTKSVNMQMNALAAPPVDRGLPWLRRRHRYPGRRRECLLHRCPVIRQGGESVA